LIIIIIALIVIILKYYDISKTKNS
jgi:hypothetical protein